jgi:hypothetical protein
MTAQVVLNAELSGTQFKDLLGNLLSGGMVFSYQQNTTIPQTTYASAYPLVISGTTQFFGESYNTNPLPLNISGLLNTEVWEISGASYTYVIKDHLGNTIETI